jgi:hypothetical protein
VTTDRAEGVGHGQREFFRALKELHLQAGKPSSRSIATAIGGMSHTTVNAALRGTKVPSWPVVAKLVEYFGGDIEVFRQLWVETREPAYEIPPAKGSEISVFVSYAHIDDQATYGRISKLIEDVANTYRSMTGKAVGVFQDVDSIKPGEYWKDRIRLGLSSSSVLLAFVSPAYLRSTNCREELSEFLAFLNANSSIRLVIPLLYADPERIEANFADDGLWKRLLDLKRVDISKLRYIDPGSSEWIIASEEIADSIDKILSEVSAALADSKNESDQHETPNSAQIDEGLLERMAAVEESVPAMSENIQHFGKLLEQFASSTDKATPDMERARTFGEKLAVSNRLAQRITPIAQNMEKTANTLVRDFSQIDFVVSYIINAARSNPDELLENSEALASVDSIWTMALEGYNSLQQIDGLSSSLAQGIGFSKNLDRPLKSMQRAFLRMADLRGILNGWREDLLVLHSINPKIVPSIEAE